MRLLKNGSVLKRLRDCQIVTYLNLTVRSAALDFAAKNICRQKYIEHMLCDAILDGIDDSLKAVEDRILERERNQAVNRAMQRLPERYRLLLIGKYYLCLSDAELASLRGCKRQSLRTVMRRAKQLMQNELEKEGITDAHL